LRTREKPERCQKVSIVDLLKLLGLESSFAARRELATELGCPPAKMGDSAQMNMWLHKTVLQKLSADGRGLGPSRPWLHRHVGSAAASARRGTRVVRPQSTTRQRRL